MSSTVFAIIGLWCTLAGSAFLFFNAVPSKDIGNITVYGPLALQTTAAPTDDDSPARW